MTSHSLLICLALAAFSAPAVAAGVETEPGSTAAEFEPDAYEGCAGGDPSDSMDEIGYPVTLRYQCGTSSWQCENVRRLSMSPTSQFCITTTTIHYR